MVAGPTAQAQPMVQVPALGNRLVCSLQDQRCTHCTTITALQSLHHTQYSLHHTHCTTLHTHCITLTTPPSILTALHSLHHTHCTTLTAPHSLHYIAHCAVHSCSFMFCAPHCPMEHERCNPSNEGCTDFDCQCTIQSSVGSQM